MRTEVGRKALVLITDGDDQGSRTKPGEAVEAAQKSDSIIYVILYEDSRFHSPRDVRRTWLGRGRDAQADGRNRRAHLPRRPPQLA
jgi:hypothetical protein